MSENVRQQDIAKLRKQLKSKSVRENFYLYCGKLNVLWQLEAKEGEEENSIKTAKEFIKACKPKELSKLENGNKVKELYNALRDAYCYLGSKGLFHYFLIAMEFDRPYNERFYQPRMKQLRQVVDDLQDLHDRKITFYLLAMPPRVGKTTLGLFFLAMCAGERPNKSSVTISYANFVASTFYDGITEFINDPRYNYAKIFPKAKIVDTNSKEGTIDLCDKQRYKTLTFRSIDGQLTGGLEANDIMYCDDLIQNIEEAKNSDRLNKAWDKVVVDIFQRMKPEEGCVFLIIGTIWSIDDPSSKLMNMYKDSPKARIRKLSALDPITDTSNFEYENGVGFSTEYYRNLRDVVYKHDPVSFSCVYQQEPMERSERDFPIDSLTRYSELPVDRDPDSVVAYCDCAFGGGDFLSMPVCAVYGDDYYIIDWIYDSHTVDVTQPRVVNAIINNKITKVVFEANNGGDLYAKEIKDKLTKCGYRCNIISAKAPSNTAKTDRIQMFSPEILTFIYKSDDLIENGTDYHRALLGLTAYSSQIVNKLLHDDAPDSLAGLGKMIKNPRNTRVAVYDRRNFPFL